MRPIKIESNNVNLCKKLNMLHYSDEVVLGLDDSKYLTKILNNINRGGIKLISEKLGKYVLIKKVNPINLNVFLKK